MSAKPSTMPVYWAGLQDDEVSATLPCGCVLHSEGAQIERDACDIAFFACPTHDHAEALRDEVEQLLIWFDQTKDDNNLARIHSCGLDAFRAILAKMGTRTLHPDAPPVPAGLRPRRGVEYGCGKAECADCYEPVQ